MARARVLSLEKQRAFYDMCMCLMRDKECDEILDLVDAFANSALESIAHNKGITDVRVFPGIAVQISHSVENEMRDYIEFCIDQEYGPDEEEKEAANESMG